MSLNGQQILPQQNGFGNLNQQYKAAVAQVAGAKYAENANLMPQVKQYTNPDEINRLLGPQAGCLEQGEDVIYREECMQINMPFVICCFVRRLVPQMVPRVRKFFTVDMPLQVKSQGICGPNVAECGTGPVPSAAAVAGACSSGDCKTGPYPAGYQGTNAW